MDNEIQEMITLYRSQAQLMRHAIQKADQKTWRLSRTAQFHRARFTTLRAAEEWELAADRLEATQEQPLDYAEEVA